VTAHGGEITVSSDVEGKRFDMTLPTERGFRNAINRMPSPETGAGH
jgi:signal transduction histidine kinase